MQTTSNVSFQALHRKKYVSSVKAHISEMTYTVSSGTLNSTIPYHQ